MSNTERAKAFMNAVGRGDAETAAGYMTDDCFITGPTPQPIGKHEFLGLHSLLARAFPDWNFNLGEATEEGDKVHLTIEITGTHTGVLDLTPTGMPVPVLQPTGKKIQVAEEHPVLTVRNGKFSELYLPVAPGGGLMSILNQLGVAVPA